MRKWIYKTVTNIIRLNGALVGTCVFILLIAAACSSPSPIVPTPEAGDSTPRAIVPTIEAGDSTPRTVVPTIEAGDNTPRPVAPTPEAGDSTPRTVIPTPEADDSTPRAVEVIAEDLSIPWEVLFLPNSAFLVTERTGSITFIADNGAKRRIGLPEVSHTPGGEGGLLGAALHPDFSSNGWLYLYSTYDSEERQKMNRVERFTLTGSDVNDFELTEGTLILDSLPGAINHDGGRIKFGPDGFLYVTVGDALSASKAQDQDTIHGTILRVTADGAPAPGNPFGSAVFSYGHRNPQGITWDEDGTLWSTEHGPSGFGSGFDEVNRIRMGGNYGWPTIQGDEMESGLESPVVHSGSRETWAPGSAQYHGGSIYFGGLRGQAVYEFNLATLSIVKHFSGEYGRVRTVRVGPDGSLYFATSNTDGRGRQNAGDDKLYRVNLPLAQN